MAKVAAELIVDMVRGNAMEQQWDFDERMLWSLDTGHTARSFARYWSTPYM